jgi:hypothetical protein
MSRYTKFLIAVLGGVASWGATAGPDGFTSTELFGLMGVIATALSVYQFPNSPPKGEPSRPEVSERDA